MQELEKYARIKVISVIIEVYFCHFVREYYERFRKKKRNKEKFQLRYGKSGIAYIDMKFNYSTTRILISLPYSPSKRETYTIARQDINGEPTGYELREGGEVLFRFNFTTEQGESKEADILEITILQAAIALEKIFDHFGETPLEFARPTPS